MAKQPPLTCTIPTPIMAPRARGANAAGIDHLGETIKVRLSDADKDLVKREAEKLGTTVSAFIRHCAIYTAKALNDYEHGTGEQHGNDH
jgi:hypothetical protein